MTMDANTPNIRDTQAPDAARTQAAVQNQAKDPNTLALFADLMGSIPLDTGKFIETKQGYYEMVDTDPYKKPIKNEDTDTLEAKQRDGAADVKETEAKAGKDANSIAFDEYITLDALPADRMQALWAHIYRRAELQLQQGSKRPTPNEVKRFIFQTEIFPNEELNIQLQKNQNVLNISLYADGDLHQFLSDKIAALRAHLKDKNDDLDDIEIELIELEQAPSVMAKDIVRQKVAFTPADS